MSNYVQTKEMYTPCLQPFPSALHGCNSHRSHNIANPVCSWDKDTSLAYQPTLTPQFGQLRHQMGRVAGVMTSCCSPLVQNCAVRIGSDQWVLRNRTPRIHARGKDCKRGAMDAPEAPKFQ